MKIKMLRGWRWIFAVSSTITLLGCLDQTSGTGAQTIVEPSAAAPISTNITEAQTDAPPAHVVIPPANLSPGLAEVVKLAQSGVSESVLMAYVEQSNHAFKPSVDEIVYLKDIGISDAVVAAMVRHVDSTNAIAESSSVPAADDKVVLEQPTTNSVAPSLTGPNAPSYSVTAEPSAAAAVAQPEQVNINYFESTLSPYGNWVDVPDYGRCWQPTVVVINRDWRPYADRGRWVYTTSGWYWQSDYSWGWAPFHYGRWYCDNRIGWVWVPGSTWGPAWVSWRYTDDYCGWAPLPPSAHYYYGSGFYYRNSRVGISFDFGLSDFYYTFIPTSHFCDRSPSHHYVSGSHSKTIYNRSVVINNYIRGNNNTVINEGVGRERITRATKTPIRTVALRELPATSTPVGRAERIEGNSLTVFRPNVSASAGSRSTPQRSVSTTGPNSHNTPSPSRSVRANSKTETPATSSVTAAPVDPLPTKVPRSSSSSIVTPAPASPTAAPKTETTSKAPEHPVVTTRPGSSGFRNIPTRNESQEHRTIERREVNVNPAAPQRSVERKISSPAPQAPSVVERNAIERTAPSTISRTPIVRENPVVRSVPSTPQFNQPPTVRETRRQETPQFNPGAQRSVRSIAPTPSAPAPVQQFNPPPQISRESRVERFTPQASPPRVSAPSESVRSVAPRQEAPAPRERMERSVERNSRSDRNRS